MLFFGALTFSKYPKHLRRLITWLANNQVLKFELEASEREVLIQIPKKEVLHMRKTKLSFSTEKNFHFCEKNILKKLKNLKKLKKSEQKRKNIHLRIFFPSKIFYGFDR